MRTRHAHVALLAAAVAGVAACGPARDDGGRPGGTGVGTGQGSTIGSFPHARTHLECTGPVGEAGAGDYVDGGLERVQDDPLAAVDDLLTEGFRGPLPEAGYTVASSGAEQALVVHEVDGAVKVAFVVEDGVEDWDGGRGWGVTSYAACDLAELPPEVAQQHGVGVWTDERGTPVPTSRVTSFLGPEHCDWQDVTFLYVGEGRDRQEFLRDPAGTLRSETRTSYAAGVDLPAGARDTGWNHGGQELWLVPGGDAAYLVSTGIRADVERWPATTGPVGCA